MENVIFNVKLTFDVLKEKFGNFPELTFPDGKLIAQSAKKFKSTIDDLKTLELFVSAHDTKDSYMLKKFEIKIKKCKDRESKIKENIEKSFRLILG